MGGIVEVGFGFRRAWLARACALDLDALNTARKKAFATKETLVIVATLVLTCKIKMKSRCSRKRD
jgi:hypothetical protein